jgi:hypothetical protein
MAEQKGFQSHVSYRKLFYNSYGPVFMSYRGFRAGELRHTRYYLALER